MMKQSAYTRAINYLDRLAQEFISNQKQRLPSVKNLALGALVSPGTMWKAMQELQKRGVLLVIPGGGAILAGRFPEDLTDKPVSTIRKCKAVQLSDIIRKDIASYRYKPGTILPSLKEFSNEFGATYRVCKQALDTLVERNLVLPYKRGYRVCDLPQMGSRASLVFLGNGDNISDFVRVTERSVDFWIALAGECRRLNIEIKILNIGADPTHTSHNIIQTICKIEKTTTVLGYLLWSLMHTPDELIVILSILKSQNKPIVALEEGTSRLKDLRIKGFSKLHFVSMAYTGTCALEIASHLRKLRHREVVYFSIIDDEVWNNNRKTAVLDAFSGHKEGTVHVIKSGLKDIGITMLKTKSFAKLRKTLIHLDTTFNGHDSPNEEFYNHFAYRFMEKQFLKSHFKPLFERALSYTNVTAWICANDALAIAALEFLRNSGIKVPQKISVTGIDDSVEALGAGLTSYNFNIAGVVHAMVGQIMGDIPVATVKSQWFEIPGYVSERMSTGVANKNLSS